MFFNLFYPQPVISVTEFLAFLTGEEPLTIWFHNILSKTKLSPSHTFIHAKNQSIGTAYATVVEASQ